MLRLRWPAGPSTSGQGRVFLRLETLEGRDLPSSLLPESPIPESPGAYTSPYGQVANLPPEIQDFTAEQVGNGLFVFTGRVVDENPAGLFVRFGGDVPTMQDLSAEVQDDGTFILIVRMQTDGTDVGFVTATTVDAQGVVSDEAVVFVSPTPPPA